MGGKEVEEKTTTPQDIIDYLYDLFSYALSIGMTYEQYWHDDPLLLKYYIKADEINRIKKNNELYLQGLYVYIAIGDLVPLLNPFSKEHKAKPYLKEPIPITEKEREQKRLERIEAWTKKMMAIANNESKNG